MTIRKAHTYRAARRNAVRAGGVLKFWRMSPYRVWMKGNKTTREGKQVPWHVLVRPMPPLIKEKAA